MTNQKKVKIADLKANLSRHLREVRAGHSLTVVDRDSPIAMLTPLGSSYAETVATRAPLSDPTKLRTLRSPLKEPRDFGSLEHLIATRGDK